jgi:lipopolysaccharide biosynthesis glycosyltransferase
MQKNKQKMRILLTFDTGYAPHAATVIESIIQNCPEKLDFAVIYYNLTQEIQDIMSKHFMSKVNSLEFLKADVSRFSVVKSLPHIVNPINVVLRLLTPYILPESDHFTIYLDCDTIVQDNILKIMEGVDLSKPICAITEYNPAYKLRDLSKLEAIERPTYNPLIYEAYWYRTYLELQMQPSDKYFCAGIMVINLDYWRKHKIAERAIDFLLKYSPYAADQDALNYVIKGNYTELHPRWNLMRQKIFSNYDVKTLREAYKNPAIIHQKGWNYMHKDDVRKLYRKYRKCTPFPRIIYKDKTVKNIIKKQFRRIIESLIGKENAQKLRVSIQKVNHTATARLK